MEIKPEPQSAAPSSQTGVCVVCRDISRITFRCNRCKSTIYCGRECQKIHWPFHKSFCSKIEQLNKNGQTDINSSEISWIDLQGKVGLNNLGNSCYLNSGVQCLRHILPITSYFISGRYADDLNLQNPDGTKGELANIYSILLRDMWFTVKPPAIAASTEEDQSVGLANFGKYLLQFVFKDNKIPTIPLTNFPAVSPVMLKKVLGRINEDYIGFVQQDTHDVLETLLDRLHEDVNRVQIPKQYVLNVEGNGLNDEVDSEEAWTRHKIRNNSVVDDVLGGQLRSQLTCGVCGHVSVSFDFNRSISLAIPRATTRLIRIMMCAEFDVIAKSITTLIPKIFAMKVDHQATVSDILQLFCANVNANSSISETVDECRVITPADVILLELLSTRYAFIGGRYISEHTQVFERENPEEKYEEIPIIPEKKDGVSRPMNVFRHVGINNKRPSMHTISKIFKSNSALPCGSADGSEFIAFVRPVKQIPNTSGIILVQREFKSLSKPTDGSNNASFSVSMSGNPCLMFINSNWSCDRMRFQIWQQVRSLYIHGLREFAKYRINLDDCVVVKNFEEAIKKSFTMVKDQMMLAKLVPIHRVTQHGRGFVCEIPKYENSWSFLPDECKNEEKLMENVFGTPLPITTELTISDFLANHEGFSYLSLDLCSEWDSKLAIITSGRAIVEKWWSLLISLDNSLSAHTAPSFEFMPVSLQEIDLCDVIIVSKEEKKANNDEMNPKDPLVGLMTPPQNKPNDTIKCHSFEFQGCRHSLVVAKGLQLLNLPALPSSTSVSLEQCFKHYTSREKLEGDDAWYCSKCKKHQPAEKSVAFWRLPDVLIVTLKRFEFKTLHGITNGFGQQHSYNEKIDTFVDFPVNSLNLHPFLSRIRRSRTRTLSNMSATEFIGSKYVNGVSTTPNVERKSSNVPNASECTYDLFAVCNHIGRSGFGHYTAFARDWRDKDESRDSHPTSSTVSPNESFAPWCEYDDESVYPVSGSAAEIEQKIKSKQAYILFYRLRKV